MDIDTILRMLNNKNIEYQFCGDKNVDIQYFSKIDLITDRTVGFCDNITKDLCEYFNEKNLVVISKQNNLDKISFLPENSNYILTDNSKLVFIYIVDIVNSHIKYKRINNPIIGKNSEVECYSIGRNVTIGNNCIIKNSVINNNVSIQSNCTIGEDGYGYHLDLTKIIN